MPIILVMDKIARVIEQAGGVSALASQLQVKPPTVSQWKSGGRKVSPRLALQITRLWPDLVTVHDLRPDIFGAAANGPIHEAAVDPAEHVHPARKPHKHVHVRSRIPN